MNIKEISVHYNRKMSDNNFGSRDVGFGMTAEVGPEEDVKEVQQALFEQCHQMAMEQFERGKVEPLQGEPNEFVLKPAGTIRNFVSGGKLKQPFDWKDTPGGEKWLERKAEIDQNFGEENGPRGSSFNDERSQSVSGQQ